MEQCMLSAVDLTRVRFADSFWAPRLETNRTRSIPHNIKWCEQTGRVANFEKAAAGQTSGHEGWFFNDSDVYKVIEGAAYHLATRRDPALEARLDGWIEKIGAVQRSDGYLNTYFQLNPHLQRWTQDQFHELYCAGTLIEAGIAHCQATDKRRLLEIALRNVELIHATFGPGRKAVAPEHPEIELALIRLAQHTGEPRHRELARFFGYSNELLVILDERGRALVLSPSVEIGRASCRERV